MFSFITPYLTAIKIALVAAAFGLTILFTHRYDVGQQAEAIAKAEAQAIERQKQQDQISLDAAVADAKAQQKIIHDTQTIIQTVTKYVVKSDHCPISVGYVRVWNNGVAGSNQGDPASQSNAAASGLDAVDALNNAIANFGTCHQIAQQLTDLQNWVTQQENVK